MELLCQNCNSVVRSDQHFCGACGTELGKRPVLCRVSPASYTLSHLAQRILAERRGYLVWARELNDEFPERDC